MSRYIDADTIEIILDGAIQGEEVTGNAPMINAHELMCMLHDIPTADVEEVVRCGDCIHWNAETKGCKRNPSVYRWYAKDFCSNGVR